MLVVDPNPPNPISSFLKTLTLKDSREPFVLPIIEDSDLDLSDLGLEEVFMTNNEPKVEEEDPEEEDGSIIFFANFFNCWTASVWTEMLQK